MRRGVRAQSRVRTATPATAGELAVVTKAIGDQ